MINIFETSFEARERRFQIEKLYHGETVDLVGVVTTNGVPQNIMGYAVSGVFQPTSMNGSPDFYELSADIVDNKVLVHWEKGKDFGENSYMVWALLTDGDNVSYPLAWRLDMAYSPSYPLSDLAPIPKAIDFSKYDLLNAPWLPLSAVDDLVDSLSDKYLPLSGGVLSGTIQATNFVAQISRGVNIGSYNEIEDNGVAIGVNSKASHGSIALGNGISATNPNGICIGMTATSTGDSSIAIGSHAQAAEIGIAAGYGSETTDAGAIAIGTGTHARAKNAIQLGSKVVDGSSWNDQYNDTPNSFKVMDKMVLSGDNLTLDPERVPYLSGYAKKEEIPEVPTDLSAFTNSPGYLTAHQSLEDYYTKTQTDEKLTAYAQLSDLENIDVGEMSACLSSDEFDEVNFLAYNSEGDVDVSAVSIQDIGNKINSLIALLRRTDDPHTMALLRKTYVKYTDNSEAYLDITGTLASNSIPNINTLKEIRIGTGVTSLANDALKSAWQALTSITVPNTITAIPNNFAKAGDYVGHSSSLSNLVLPDTIVTIGQEAFRGNHLTSLTLPANTTTINNGAFDWSNDLTEVHINAALTSIGYAVFGSSNKLSSFTVDPNNQYFSFVSGMLIGNQGTAVYLIPKTTVGTVVVPEGVTTLIRDSGSSLTGVTSITLPSTLTTIKEAALVGTSGWSSLTIPSSVSNIEIHAFEGSGVKTYTFEGKTMAQVQGMSNYSQWKMGSGSTIICTDGTITR